MKRAELTMGSATFIAVIAAGWLSVNYVDRHFATAEADKKPASSDRAEASSTPSGACVNADGSWKNWPWANVPMLSPKCPPDR